MKEVILEFEDNSLLSAFYGSRQGNKANINLAHIEDKLGVNIADRGNTLTITGDIEEDVQTAKIVLEELWQETKDSHDKDIGPANIDALFKFHFATNTKDIAEHRASPANKPQQAADTSPPKKVTLKTPNKQIHARTPKQAEYLNAILAHKMCFGLGPAGTGKTYLAVAKAVEALKSKNSSIERIIISRPAVEAGERLGFLPGDLKEKVDPYLRPIYDALYDMMGKEEVDKLIEKETIEIAPLAFMRGRTLSKAFIILDEAQNTTSMQMKMALTRFGEDSKMVINGDLSQTDLPNGVISGLREASHILKSVHNVSFIEFQASDVVRDKLVGDIVNAYDQYRTS